MPACKISWNHNPGLTLAGRNFLAMNRETVLFATSEVRVARFDHPAGFPHKDPCEEVANEFSVSLVERGNFEVRSERRHWQLQPGDVFLVFPELVYSSSHRERIPTDVCLSVRYQFDGRNQDQFSSFHHTARKHRVLPATNRLAYLFRGLAAGSFMPSAALGGESSAVALMHEVCNLTATPQTKRYREHQLNWYVERVDAAREVLEKECASEHSLGSLARSVGMSTFHFARVFSELVGMPPHRYLLRVRLNRAARQLKQACSVTDACFSSGFRNLSHFIRLFERHFGISPSFYARNRSGLH